MSDLERIRQEQREAADYITQFNGSDVDGATRGLGDWFAEEMMVCFPEAWGE